MELAREITELDERGEIAVPRGRDLGRALAQLRRRRSIAEEGVQVVLVACVTTFPDSTSVTPYSEIESPRRCASSRSAMLWSFEPVKCCRTLP